MATVSASAQSQTWFEQFGSDANDINWFASRSTATSDSEGGVYVCGETAGSLGGPSVGFADAWLARFDRSGQRLWLSQFGSEGGDLCAATAEVGDHGVYVCGDTTGSLGGPNAGSSDIWVARWSKSGTRVWVRQFGTDQSDYGWSVSPDGSDGVYVCGATYGTLVAPAYGGLDAVLTKFDKDGGQLWTRQFGTPGHDYAFASAPDSLGGLFVAGHTTEVLDHDAWVVHFDAEGHRDWRIDIGTNSEDEIRACCPDGSGGFYLSGWTTGDFGGASAGGLDAWLARFDADGGIAWVRQLGTAAGDIAYAVVADSAGGVVVGGVTGGPLASAQMGLGDIWLARFDATGAELWMDQFGSTAPDVVEALSADAVGGVFAFGSTAGSLGGQNKGQFDAWLARYDGSCNPGTTYCVASSTSIAGCQASITASGSPTLSDPTAWTVTSGPVPGANLGLLLFGSSGKDNTPYGTLGGQLCVAAPTFRTAPKTSGGDQGQCNGSYAFALADLIAASPIVTSGATINAQVWARDPANADGFLLSDGLEIVVCP